MTIWRSALSVLLAVFVAFFAAAPAMAHTTLKSSDPADGASLSTAPEKVTLTFEEAVTLPAAPISITGPDGSSWTVGKATVSGAAVTAPVETRGPAGKYTLNYTVIADDGDDVKGAVRFTLATAATPTSAASPTTATEATAPATAVEPTAPTATGQRSGAPAWVWVVVALIVIAVLAGLGLARSRRSEAARHQRQ